MPIPSSTRSSIHVEACPHLHRTVTSIKAAQREAGVVLNPATPLSSLEEILPEADYVLLMSVNPGWSGQKFIPHVRDKIVALRGLIRDRGLSTRIEVDGGVTRDNVGSLVQAGADIIVAGSSVFGQEDPGAAAAEMMERMKPARA
jgi:ribulose-phosphate 3-epimerase